MLPNAPDRPDAAWHDKASAQRWHADVRLHQVVVGIPELLFTPRFMAVALADGSSDRTLYDTYEQAWRHHTNKPSRYFYPRVFPESVSERICDTLLWYVRQAYNNGWRSDPAHQLILPTRLEDLNRITNGTRGVSEWRRPR